MINQKNDKLEKGPTGVNTGVVKKPEYGGLVKKGSAIQTTDTSDLI